MAWATTSDTLALTGVTVSDAVLAQAQGVIELYAGISEGNSADLSDANQRMLKAAVAYQAAWMHGQVDVTTRSDVAQLQQDGATVVPTGQDALLLAPLARRALDRLSWLRVRRTTFKQGRRPLSFDEYRAAWLRDEVGHGAWRPL